MKIHGGPIIISVDEKTDYSICNVANDQNRKKTQDIVVFLREKKFAGGIRPTVYVQPLSLNKNKIDDIERLWKKKFGIDATALDRALLFLPNPCEWIDSDDGEKYYKYAPEFTLEGYVYDRIICCNIGI